MATFLAIMFWNAVEASVLALAVAVACRVRRIPAPARHVLWLLVIVKLLLPPVAVQPLGLSAGRVCVVDWLEGLVAIPVADRVTEVQLPLRSNSTDADSDSARIEFGATPRVLGEEIASQPSVAELLAEIQAELALAKSEAARGESLDATQSAEAAAAGSAVESAAEDAALSAPRDGAVVRELIRRHVSWPWIASGLVGLWAAGTIVLVAIRVRQWLVVWRMVRDANQAPRSIHLKCASLARRLGVRRVPRVVLTSEVVSPSVCMWGSGAIVLPVRLARDGEEVAIQCVVAHELAHLRRRDHWACWLELAASLVYWWLPVFWCARRRLRGAADEAADAWAVSVVGGRQRYAESLLQVVELIAAEQGAVPVFGPALGERDAIARRLTMIMREPLSHRLSWPARLGVALVGLLVLPAAPRTKAQEPNKPLDPPVSLSAAAAEPAPPAAPAVLPAGIPTEEEFSAVLEALEPQPPGVPPQAGRGGPPGVQPPFVRSRIAAQAAPPGAPAAPVPPFQRDARSRPDPDRRLQELEEKVERVLHMLEAMQGPGGGRPAHAQPGGPPAGPRAGMPPAQPGGPGHVGPAMGGFGPGTGMGGGAFGGMAMSRAGAGAATGGGSVGGAFGGTGGAGGGMGAGTFPGSGGPTGGSRSGFGSMFFGRAAGGPPMSGAVTGPPGGLPGGQPGMPGSQPPQARGEPSHNRGPERGPSNTEDAILGLELRIEHAMKDVQAEIQKIEAEQARAMQEFQRRRAELERRRGEIIRDVLSPEQRERMEGQRREPGASRPRDGAEGRRPGSDDRPRESAAGRRESGPDRPREGTEPRRAPGGDRPREGGDRPREGGDRPREGGDRPREGGDRPREGGDRPRREGGDRPREGGDRPRDGGDRPREGGDRPREGGDRPRDGGDRPREGASADLEAFQFFVGF